MTTDYPPNFPPSYIRNITTMSEALSAWLKEPGAAARKKPEFWLPPSDTHFIAPLDAVYDQVCRNETAKEIAKLVDAAAGHEATVAMLDVVLSLHGIAVRRVSLAELGFVVETNDMQAPVRFGRLALPNVKHKR